MHHLEIKLRAELFWIETQEPAVELLRASGVQSRNTHLYATAARSFELPSKRLLRAIEMSWASRSASANATR